MGYLEWAAASIPTKYGDITVHADTQHVEISVPSGTVMEWNGRTITGSAEINKPY